MAGLRADRPDHQKWLAEANWFENKNWLGKDEQREGVASLPTRYPQIPPTRQFSFLEVRIAQAGLEAGIQRYRVGTDTPRFLATSFGGVPEASSLRADWIFTVGHAPLPAAGASQAPGGIEAGTRALHNQLALHLRQARHHMKEEPARRRAGVDRVGEALELDALMLRARESRDEIRNIERPLEHAAAGVSFRGRLLGNRRSGQHHQRHSQCQCDLRRTMAGIWEFRPRACRWGVLTVERFICRSSRKRKRMLTKIPPQRMRRVRRDRGRREDDR